MNKRIGDLLYSFSGKSARPNRDPLLRRNRVWLKGLSEGLSGAGKVNGPFRRAASKLKGAKNHLFDVSSSTDLPCITTVLPDDRLLIRSFRQPVHILSSRTRKLTSLGERTETCEDKHWSAAYAGVMEAMCKGLGSNIHMDDNGLWLIRDT